MNTFIHQSFIILLLSIGFGLVSCSPEEGNPEQASIAKEKMEMILKEMQIGQAGIDLTIHDGEKRKERYKSINQSVLKRHQVDPEVFYNAFDWYQHHPEILDSIYGHMIEGINLELSEAKAKQKLREIAEKDSLRKLGKLDEAESMDTIPKVELKPTNLKEEFIKKRNTIRK